MLAASRNPNPEVVTVLLRAGAEVNARTEPGFTPLMYAAMECANPEVITVLLKAGADIHSRSVSGWTPLMVAAGRSSNPEVLSVLIKAGADLTARCQKGKTAPDYARANEKFKGTTAYQEIKEAYDRQVKEKAK